MARVDPGWLWQWRLLRLNGIVGRDELCQWLRGYRGTGEEAVTAFKAALGERTRERVPLAWAMTQDNLGNVLSGLGELESDTAHLEEAVAAYRRALEVRTRERVPLDWAATQNNLGGTLLSLYELESGMVRLEEALECLHSAAEAFAAAGADHFAAVARENLEEAQRLLDARVHDAR
ncbi:MAG TPA: tetratricopeptide repeat protein [Longimicrobium sp.]